MIVTAKRIPKRKMSFSGDEIGILPVPDPMAPSASAITDRAPMHIPPNQAAVGIYLNK